MKNLIGIVGLISVLSVGVQAANISFSDTISDTQSIGTGDRLLQRDGNTATITTGGSLTLESGSTGAFVGQVSVGGVIIDGGDLNYYSTTGNFLIGNGTGGNGTVDLRAGTLTLNSGGALAIGRDAGTGVLTIRGGVADLNSQPVFDIHDPADPGAGSIDFADKIGGGASDGTLTIAGADYAYYESLYTGDDLTYNGDNSTYSFSEVFSVSNETLSVLPAATVAVITPSTTSGYAPLDVVFDGSGSTADGTITNYFWDFGDGDTAAGVRVTNTYTTVTNYTAWLTVMDDLGHAASNSVSIKIWSDSVVYGDMFDNDGLSANTGVGGGLSVTAANLASWGDGGELAFSPDTGAANERAVVSSLNSFNLPFGFELTVTYSVGDITTDTGGNRFSFGLMNAVGLAAINTDPFALDNGTRPDDYQAIGVNVTAEDSLQGLVLNERSDGGTIAVGLIGGQSGFTSSTTAENIVTLTVDAAGNYDLVLNGSSVGSGASGLDLRSAFYFAAFSQDDLASPSITSVSLSDLSDPDAAPVAYPQDVGTWENNPVEITLAGIDSEGSNLTYSVESFPTNGSLAGATNVWVYTPTDGYLGTDQFTFTVHNGEINSAPATVSINVSYDELFEGPEYEDAFTNPEDDPELPNVLLIGDSISNAYTVQVRKSLAGRADVFRIPSNGKDTWFGLDNLDSWLAMTPGQWDLIHFNWGLWDLCYRNPESTNQGYRDKVNGTLTTTTAEYADNMEQIVARMKQTGATLMWRTTTPVPEGELGRIEGDDLIYNAIAESIMTTNGVLIDDLHSYALLGLPEIQVAYGDVHFTSDGSIFLGKRVAFAIEAALFGATIDGVGAEVSSDATDMVLNWQAQPGAPYGVMATTNLVDGPWIDVTNGITAEDLVSVTNTVSGEQQFFRVYIEY
ncbi:PKD domain-containing protein [Pontiellaceae bacterium B12227]|nr:PKD domain-containing protein [Pontiellaceae bacterium B12227]